MSLRVYKVGGPALEDPDLCAPLAAEVRRGPDAAVLVHGGGRQVERALLAREVPSRFVDGRRVTTAEAMETIELVLSGMVNKALAAGLTAAGAPAVGVSGRDATMIRARLLPELGWVGSPEHVDTKPLEALLRAGFVPVVSPVSAGPSGEAVNVNADEAALAIARALGASSLVYLSDVDGVRMGGEALATLAREDAERGIASGAIAGGMVMKVRVALEACAVGIPEVMIAGRARLEGRFAGTRLQAAGVLA